VLSLEVIEALTDYVKFVDLTGDWIKRNEIWVESWRCSWKGIKVRTFSVKFVSLVTKMNDVLRQDIELGSDHIETLGETSV
jgi:hypothetical protein